MSLLTKTARRGFTLTEIMVTVTLTGLFFAGAMPFLLTNTRYLYTSEQKLLINGDIRDVTNELVETARASNYFVLYESFHNQNVAGSDISRDANGSGAVNMNDRRQSGEDGTFIVFVFYEDPFYDSRLYDADPTNDPSLMGVRIERIVGYWSANNRRFPGEKLKRPVRPRSLLVGDDRNEVGRVAIVDCQLFPLCRRPNDFVAVRRHYVENFHLALRHLAVGLSVGEFQVRAAAVNRIPVRRPIAFVPMEVLVEDGRADCGKPAVRSITAVSVRKQRCLNDRSNCLVA